MRWLLLVACWAGFVVVAINVNEATSLSGCVPVGSERVPELGVWLTPQGRAVETGVSVRWCQP